MSWRPEGFNPEKPDEIKEVEKLYCTNTEKDTKIMNVARQLQLMRIAYHAGFNKGANAGADAMLAGIRKIGAHGQTGKDGMWVGDWGLRPTDLIKPGIVGTWVFIFDNPEVPPDPPSPDTYHKANEGAPY